MNLNYYFERIDFSATICDQITLKLPIVILVQFVDHLIDHAFYM